MAEMKENCRKQTGNLKINNKLYPIYEGLNIIGRDIKATITLKETIFSKLHAIISVVDANSHFISDLDSSNGTQVRKTKLIPYKFYSINDHEPIIFGDIVGMYFKSTESQMNCVNGSIHSSQNVNHDAATQILTDLNNTVENIHDLPTQPFLCDNKDIHNASTQLFIKPNNVNSLNILHEAPTQLFPDPNNISKAKTVDESQSFNIHEAPTQIFAEPLNINNATQSLNVHDAPTQVLPETNSIQISDIENKHQSLNIHDAPTQFFETNDQTKESSVTNSKENVENLNSSNYNINNESDDDATQDLDKVVDTQDDLDVLSRTEAYDDILANESFRCSLQTSVVQFVVDETVLVPKSKNDDDNLSDDDIILSTQDTETIDQKYREHQNEMSASVDKLDTVSDSDATDVEDDDLLIAKAIPFVQNITSTNNVEITENRPVINEDKNEETNFENSDDEEIDLLASATIKSGSNTEESCKNDSVAQDNSINDCKTNHANDATKELNGDEDMFLAPTQILITNSVENPSNENCPIETDTYLAATQKLSSEEEPCDNKITENDDIYSAATQKLSLEEEPCDNKITKNDDIYFAATQKLSLEEESRETKITKNDDIYFAATQKLSLEEEPCDNKITENDDIYSAATQKLSSENVKDITENNMNENGDIYSAATQKLVLEEDKKICENIVSDSSSATPGKLPSIENDEEIDIYSAPTQMLLPPEIKEPTDNKTTQNNIQDEDSIFAAATQIRAPEDQKSNENDLNEDVYMAATQILTTKPEESSHRLSIDESTEDASMHLHLSESEHSTRHLHDSKIMDPLKQQDTETQLEVDFELETQKLYIEEKTRRPDNPISHLFAAEDTQMTETCDEIKINDDEMECKKILLSSKLLPIVSLVDIKKSKITLKDRQEASTSKIKKSYIKLERIKQEPTRRSTRNRLDFDMKISGNQNDELSPEEEIKTLSPVTSEISVPQEKPTKRNNNLSKLTNEKEQQQSSDNIDWKKTKTRVKSKPELKSQLLELIEYSAANPVDSDLKINTNLTRLHNTRGKRLDYKYMIKEQIAEMHEIESRKRKSLENHGKITTKSFMKEKIDELEIHVKDSKPLPKDASDSDSDFKAKRSKRISNYNSNCKIDKELAEKTPENSENNTTIEDSNKNNIEINVRKKSARATNTRIIPTLEETVKTTNNRKRVSKIESNAVKTKRSKNRKQTVHENSETIIEDSDESILDVNTIKQESKNDKISDDVDSDAFTGRKPRTVQTRKRSIQKQHSPERIPKQDANDICLNTPNSKRRKYEPLTVSISSSQMVNNESSKHKVVFTMLNGANLENIVHKLGGTVVDSIHTCTVLVTNKISRSLKFLIAVALGKPIVHVKWIQESEKRKTFLDPWDYLLEDTESEQKFQMSLKESLIKSRTNKLFSGEIILLATIKNFDVLKEIIETSGGKCVTRAPPKSTNVIVVCYEDEKSKYSRYLKQKTCTVVSAEAVFSGVLQQNINWKQYLLSSNY